MKSLSFISALTVLSATAVAADSGPSYFFTFGDSYTRNNWDPNVNVWPSDDLPMGIVSPGVTSSGGLSWPGYIIEQFNTTKVYLYDFAVGGSVTQKLKANGDIDVPDPLRRDFVQQTDLFLSTVGKQPISAPWTADNSYVGLWVGGNDMREAWSLTNFSNYDKVADIFIAQCEKLYTAGLRNFIFLTIPPRYLTPKLYHPGTQTYATNINATSYLNGKLLDRISSFVAEHSDINSKVVDTYGAFVTAFQNPRKFGKLNKTCFGRGQYCLWLNDYHPTTLIHQLVAVDVAKAWNSGPFACPTTVKYCVSTPKPKPL